jgi:hypothetical protein
MSPKKPSRPIDPKAAAQAFVSALLGDTSWDELRTLVDWPRFRLMQLMQATAGSEPAARDQLLSRALDALAVATPGAEAEERALRSLAALIEVLIGKQWRFVDEWANPLLKGLRAGPLPGTPPGLKRYLERLAEVANAATAVTMTARDPEATKLMTLLFVDGLYAGFLPGELK